MSSNAHPNPKTKIIQKANNQMMSKSSEEKKRKARTKYPTALDS